MKTRVAVRSWWLGPRLISTARLLGLLAWTVPAAAAGEVTLYTRALEFSVSTNTGAYAVRDRDTGVVWRSNPFEARLGTVELGAGNRTTTAALGRCEAHAAQGRLELTFRPVPERPEGWLRVEIRATRDGRTLEFAWDAARELAVRRVWLLERALGVGAADRGGMLVPVRLGLFIPADSGWAFQHTFDTYAYEGCHMAMLGVLKQGAAALVHWRDPYIQAEVESVLTNRSGFGPDQVLTASLVLQGSARRFSLRLLGRGDHVTVARAYREVAQREGWWVPWERKLAEQPARARLFGASNYKLWSLLDRRMSEDSTREERVTVNWTFDEAAQVAEHLRQDLKLERVLFLMGGWIHRGYDNQHPDILPAAPECGGNEAFAECARRIRALGYVLGLHDNYQDIYRDSPSWDENLIMKNRDGSLVRGGHWAGGRAYLTCSKMAVDLARRPQNLPAVHRLTSADAYFIDTTYAAGLMECFDPNHPLTRHDDLYWKQAISDYARGVFGIFGSECGREWAIPHSDFFEGLTGVSGRHFHDAGLEAKVGGVMVPLFEMVYRECIAMYGKYGYDIRRAAGYVLDHLLIGRPLHYHSVPPHLYWRQSADEEAVTPAIGEFEAVDGQRFLISYRWHVHRAPARNWRVFVHFTTPDGRIAFQDDHDPDTPATQWNPGVMEFGTFARAVPEWLRGTFDIRMGLFDPASGERAPLPLPDDGERRHVVGRVTFTGERIRFEPVRAPEPGRADPAVFVRGDGGWTAGLHAFDRFVKNTHELLSPLNEITARMPLTEHRFLSADRKWQRTVFGSGRNAVTVTVHSGEGTVRVVSALGGVVVLPPYGFLVESPEFVAFHALTWAGRQYTGPVMFTVRSLDGQPLARSGRLRVFHGWGESEIRVGDRELNVPREAVLDFGAGH
jgi:hypothetical protein